MGIESQSSNFGSIFGANGGDKAPASAGAKDRPASQYWLNIGREAGEGDNARFVSLPMGVAVDGMKPTPIRGSNEEYNSFTATRNAMLDRVVAICGELEPGEERIVNLQVQVRRINADVDAPAVTEDSLYATALNF